MNIINSNTTVLLSRLAMSLALGILVTLGASAQASAIPSNVSSPPISLLASGATSLMSPPVHMETEETECGDSNGDGECDTNSSED